MTARTRGEGGQAGIRVMCRTCAHSEGRASMLAGGYVIWCALHKTVPQRVCGDWERYPGAEDE